MRTLFGKMFIFLWLTSTVAGLVSFNLEWSRELVSLQRNSPEHLLRHAGPLLQLLPLYGNLAATSLEREGTAPPLGSSEPASPGSVSGSLFTIDGTPLSAATPQELGKTAGIFAGKGAPADNPYLVAHQKGNTLVALRVTGPSGKPYIAAGMVASLPFPRTLGFIIPPDMGFRIGVSIVFIGIACYLLSWWLTKPVRQLRVTAQRLADGDLTVRARVSRHHDEIDDLGHDFNRMAERIENLIAAHRQLVRDVSHELRSPLARLNVALGLARRENGAAPEAALDRIEREAERLNFLISDLLTLSLLEGGGDALVTAPFQLCELVQEVTDDADFEAASRNRQVLTVSCEPTTLMGNRELLRRALENIVRNAVRYTKEGTSVQVSLGHSPSGQALLTVRDHGPGVPESALANIFLPFYRVAADRDRHSGGAGIGLAIADRTVRLSGGSIQARNAPGGGLEIEMRLPLAQPVS